MNYPKHCIGCWKEQDCQQKFFMNANTESVEGYVDFDLADYVCGTCLDDNHNTQYMDDPEVDNPAHCSICGVPLHCQLTEDGIGYVEKTLTDDGGCCRELWPVLFSDYLA